ncbi:Cytolysin/lectin [Mycena albidolilacea]|uniref:Cytolysin/lectin n=1 Tax=Mycena albidolilacea TaxID=1033008 RepID=A0AAD7F4P2_9AGAR|nr:Cytolysin/lectin [Mycena albidolilacea]
MDPVINLYYRLYKGQTPAPSKFPLQPSQSNASVIDTNFIAPPYTVENIVRYILEREGISNDGKAEVYIDRKDVKPAPPGTILDIEGPSTKSNAAIRVILPAVSSSQTTTTPGQTTTTPGQTTTSPSQTSTAGQTTTTPGQTTTSPSQTSTAGQTTTTPGQTTTSPIQTNTTGQTSTTPGQTTTSPSQTSNTNSPSSSSSNVGGAYTIAVRVFHINPNKAVHWRVVEYGTGKGDDEWDPIPESPVLRMPSSGTSGSLRFVNSKGGEQFVLTVGVHNYKRWCDIVTGVSGNQTAMVINGEYYGGGSRHSAREKQGSSCQIASKYSCVYSVAEGKVLVADLYIQ